MTPLLRFMRQRTRLTRTLTRDPHLIGSTRQRLTRTLTCDPYQIGSNPARQQRHTRTLTYVLLSVRNTRTIVTRGPSHTTPSLGQSMGRRMPAMASERRKGEKGTMGGLVTTDTTILPRTNTGHDLTHITHLQPQPNTTNPTCTTTLGSTKALGTRNPNQEDIHNQTTVKWI